MDPASESAKAQSYGLYRQRLCSCQGSKPLLVSAGIDLDKVVPQVCKVGLQLQFHYG